MENRKLLFISHAEKDIGVVSSFVDLLYAIGLKEENMFCSSISELSVPIRKDIYEYLRNLLDSDNVIPIFILSHNYYESAACLNEMGAVWMKQKDDYFTFLLPEFEFKHIKGAINPNRKAIKLDNNVTQLKGELTNFKNEICTLFHTNLSENRWEKLRDNFIDKVNSFSTNIIIDLSQYRGFCIGDDNCNGCKVDFDKATKKIVATYDFSKTTSEICSLVFFTGELDLYNYFSQNKHLCFAMKTKSKSLSLIVEIRLKTHDVQYPIRVTNDWTNYSLLLRDFKGLDTDWHTATEIKFLAYRNDVQKATIEIRDIKITA